MFTWICPKCGTEVPPAYSDCPNCAAAQQPAAAAPAPPPAASQGAQPAPPEAVPPPAAVPVAHPPAAHRPGHVSVPGWLLSVLIGAVLIIVVGLTLMVVRKSSGSVPEPAAAVAPLEAPGPGAPAGSSPALRNVELTGLRLTEDDKHKAFVQVIVVNHSAADLGELTAKVNLRSVAKQAGEPVGTFSFKASLGPYESKEVKAPLATTLRVYELPDWQFLRAEIVP